MSINELLIWIYRFDFQSEVFKFMQSVSISSYHYYIILLFIGSDRIYAVHKKETRSVASGYGVIFQNAYICAKKSSLFLWGIVTPQ